MSAQINDQSGLSEHLVVLKKHPGGRIHIVLKPGYCFGDAGDIATEIVRRIRQDYGRYIAELTTEG